MDLTASFSCADYQSLSESSDAGTDSEDERRVREQNRLRSVAAAQVAPPQPQAQAAPLQNGGQTRARKRRSSSVVTLNSVAAPAGGTAQVPTPVKRTRKKKAAAAPQPDTTAVAEEIGKALGLTLGNTLGNTLQTFIIPKKSSKVEKPEDDEDLEEEDTIMVEEDVSIKDNSEDTLDLALRSKIRVPNAAAESWWAKSWTSQRTSRPIRGASLYLEDLQGATRPNDTSIMKFHDRMSPMKLIYLASKNQDVSSDSTELTHKKGKSWTLKKDWVSHCLIRKLSLTLTLIELQGKFETMEEVVDAVENWSSLTFMTRWMSYEASAFRRVMADLRWVMLLEIPWQANITSYVLSGGARGWAGMRRSRSHGWRTSATRCSVSMHSVQGRDATR